MSQTAQIILSAVDQTRQAFDSAANNVKSLDKSVNQLKQGLGALISVNAAKDILMTADAYNRLEARIQSATKFTGDYVVQSARLKSIALETGTSLESAVGLQQAFGRLSQELNLTGDQSAKLIANFQKAGVIGGASTEAMTYGLRQFTQAMGQTNTRAEEWNSLLENVPEVANRIAMGMGKTTGEVTRLVREGKLLSLDVMNGLLKQSAQIAADFKSLPDNLERSTNRIKTAFGLMISEWDRALGITQKISKVFTSLAHIMSPEGDTADQLQEQIDDLEARNKSLMGRLNTREDKTARWNIALNLVEIKTLEEKLDKLNRIAAAEGEAGSAPVTAIVDTQTDKDATKAIKERWEGIRRAMRGFATEMQQEEYDQELQTWQLKMTIRGERMEQEVARAMGYTNRRQMAEREAEIAHQENLIAQTIAVRERGFQDQIAQLQGFENHRAMLMFESDQKLEQERNAAEIRRILGFDTVKQELRFQQEEATLAAEIQAMTRIAEEKLALELGFEDIRHQTLEDKKKELEDAAFEEKLRRQEQVFEDELAQLLGFEDEKARRLSEQRRRQTEERVGAQLGENNKLAPLVKKLATFEMMTARQKRDFLLDTAGELTAGLAQTSETAFKINKAIAIAQAVINTAEGVTVALRSVPFPYNLAAAAIVGAAGALQIATIASTEFGGGASRGSGSLSGIPSQANSSNQLPPAPVFSEATQNQGSNLTLKLRLDGGDKLSRALMEDMRASIEERDVVLIPPNSRQAEVLRTPQPG